MSFNNINPKQSRKTCISHGFEFNIAMHYLKQCISPLNPYYKNKQKKLIICSAINTLAMSPIEKLVLDETVDQKKFFDLFISLARKGIEAMKLQISDVNFTIFQKHDTDYKTNFTTYNLATDILNLMSMGMAFFPAIILLNTEPTKRAQIKINLIPDDSTNYTMSEVVTGMFLLIFYAITIANLPITNAYVPKIIRDTFGTSIDPAQMLKNIFACPLQKLDLSFVQDFPYNELPEKFKNRLSLSVAGYRILSAFGQAKWKSNVTKDILDLQIVVNSIIAAGPDQNVHPLFRNTNIVRKYGSINKSLMGILNQYADDNWLVNAVGIKILYELPRPYPINPQIYKLDLNDFNKNPIKLDQTPSAGVDVMTKAITK